MTANVTTQCPKCNGTMERGFVQSSFAYGRETPPEVEFTVPGAPATLNPIEAFKQGLRGEIDRDYHIIGIRCSSCEYLELYAVERT